MPDEYVYDVLCYGTISIENVTRLPYLPTPKRDASASSEHDEVGGEALNVAIQLSVWGLRVVVVGNFIGTDRKGEFIMSELRRWPAVDCSHIVQHPNVVTPFSRVLVTPDGERSRIAYWFDQTPKDELTPQLMTQARILSVDSYGRDERDRAARIARELGRPVISADAIWPQYALSGLSDVTVISSSWLQGNFPGVYEYDHALELQARGAGAIIITDGPRPVLVVRPDGSPFGVEPYELPGIVDTSGAGDVFKAGMLFAWLQTDWSLEQKVKFACAAAALNATRDRMRDPLPTLAQIASLMKAQPR